MNQESRKRCAGRIGGSRLPLLALCLSALLAGAAFGETVQFDGSWTRSWHLAEGETVQIQVGIANPGGLPTNGRISARWSGPPLGTAQALASMSRGDLVQGEENGWAKVLHALDPDVYLTYRAPRSGAYELSLTTVTDEPWPAAPYHRDHGLARLAATAPARTPGIGDLAMTVDVTPVSQTVWGDIVLETEPNNAPEQAVVLPFEAGNADQVLRVIGGTDELEYFDNAAAGSSPDDWYRFVYRGDRSSS